MWTTTDDLGWILTKMCDLCLEGEAFIWIFDLIEVDAIFVSEGIENVHVFYCLLTPLFITVNKINPLLDVFTDI